MTLQERTQLALHWQSGYTATCHKSFSIRSHYSVVVLTFCLFHLFIRRVVPVQVIVILSLGQVYLREAPLLGDFLLVDRAIGTSEVLCADKTDLLSMSVDQLRCLFFTDPHKDWTVLVTWLVKELLRFLNEIG